MGQDRAVVDLGTEPCPQIVACPNDLTWLLHQAAHRMRVELDAVAVSCGLNDARDWIVLTALCDGRSRTQLELSRAIGLDKTTLIAVLDRLERGALVIRAADPDDRRVRIPQITAAGRRVQRKVTAARDCTEANLLADIEPAKRAQLMDLLTHIAALGPS